MTTRSSTLVAALVAVVLVTSGCRLPKLKEAMVNAPALAQTSIMYAADHSIITEFHAEQNRELVPLKKIPVEVRNAVIAVEDKRYYVHGGVDLRAVLRAAYQNVQQGSIVQGGSTITEQYIKNTLLSSEQTLKRKFDEAVLAIQLEQQYTKDQILDRYLNTVYFGQGAYGIQAAAHTYFSKDPIDLNLPQAAMLAGLIRAPSRYDPLGDSHKSAIERRNTVLELMQQQGLITDSEYQKATGAKLELKPEKTKQETYEAPYFVDYVRSWFLSNPKFGGTYEERYDLLFNGGLRIQTTLDPELQRYAESAVDGTLTNSSDPYGAITVIDPTTGGIKAMVGGRDYFAKRTRFSKLNLATGGSTGRQAGSAFKPFVLVAALEEGMSPNRTYSAPGCIVIHTHDGQKPWNVCNAEPSGYGSLSITQATIHSVNTVFAQIIMDVGPEQAVKVAHQMGIRCCTLATQPQGDLLAVPSAVLGANEVNTLEMASAFGTLATGGVRVTPTAITKIMDSNNNTLYQFDPDTRQVIPPDIAAKADSILQGVVTSGTGVAANIGRPQIGKTGTAQNYSDAWFIGAIPQLTAAVWVGYPQGQKSMCCTRIGTVFGGTWPAQIWKKFMLKAVHGLPKEQFPKGGVRYVNIEVDSTRNCLPNKYTPPGLIKKTTYIEGQEPTKKCTQPTTYQAVPVPSVIGMSEQRAKTVIKTAGFEVKFDYEKSNQTPGFVIQQSPAAGEDLQTNKPVVLVISKEPS